MSKHPFRKALGLTVLYSTIIIGIFVLQFKNESVILKNIGLMRMSLAQTQSAEGTMSLKNTVSVSFKGISFTADDVHPAKLTMAGSSKPKNLTLVSWEQPTPQSFKVNFTENTSLVFAVNDTSSKASLSVSALLPAGGKSISLYYKPVSGYSVTEQSKTRQLFSSKNVSYTMSAADIKDTEITLTNAGNVAMYTRYDPSKTFTFASIPADSETATVVAYENTLKKFRTALIAATEAAFADASSLSETEVAAYVAEMSAQGRYTDAINAVPDFFKKGTRRSYITAPYFNTLVAMNPSLVMANENFAGMVKNAVAQNSLDVFAADNINEYLLRTQDKDASKALAALPGSLENFQPTLAQATGIINVYLTLAKNSSPLAASLSPVIDGCINSIAALCSISSDNLIIQEKDAPVSFIQSVETGTALLDYGRYTSNSDYCAGGYMIINTAFGQNSAPDLHTMAEIYPSLVKNNTAYPHSQLIYTKNTEPVWAWTCSNNISYEENEAGTEASIVVSFKQGDTQYIILNGIKPFTGIEIYGLSFHTDPRFETYNSSGYVYHEKTHTLFLKSRHKVSNEKIHLYFRSNAQPAPAPAAAPAAPASSPASPAETAPATPAPAASSEYTPIPETSAE